MTHKLYDVLGVDKNASQDQIKSAYRKLAIQTHPDKGGDAEKFKEIASAYDVLGDEQKRNEYNQIGDEGLSGGGGGGGFPGGMNPHDLFAQMFGGGNPFGGGGGGGGGGFPGFSFDMSGFGNMGHGGRRNQEVRRADHNHEIHITLNDAYYGIHKSVKVCITKTCMSCVSTCTQCQGQGMINEIHRNGPFTQISQRNCDRCRGTCFMSNASPNCGNCKGTGIINEEKKIDINVPRGVSDKDFVYTVKGHGEQPQAPNEKPGDLIIRIIVDKHPEIIREGYNLRNKVFKISFNESMLGKDIDVLHIEGIMKLNTAFHFGIIQPKIDYTLKGKGMPYESNPSKFGDMIINFEINYPSKKLSKEDIDTLSNVLKDIGI